jgi:hypothetical protein
MFSKPARRHGMRNRNADSAYIGQNKEALMKLMTLIRLGAGLAVLTITILSVVPGNVRPHILGNDRFEHFAAYFLTASLCAIGCPMQMFASGVLLVIGAGSLELAQLWIPGRMASAGEFAMSAIGTWAGLLTILAVRRAHERASASY